MTEAVDIPPQPETVTYRPMGSGVERRDGEVLLQFLIPGKIVTIALPEGEAEQVLLTQLTGGITIARSMPPGNNGSPS